MNSVTIRDVAREAGVSLGTASRVINGAPNVGPAIILRVQAAISKLGFVPNRTARAMRGVSREVGIIVRDITIPVLAGLVKSAQDVFDELGYVMLVSSAENQREREFHLLDQFSRRRVDGLIMTTASESDVQLAAARQRANFPVLLLDRDTEGISDCVLIDHASGTHQAVSYLLSLGHRRILLVTGDTSVYPARARIAGYRNAYADAGIPCDPKWIRAGNFEAQSALVETGTLLDGRERPTAVIAGGIDMLAGVLKAVRSRGLRVPEDLSVIGNCDSDLAVLATPPITVVKWDYAEIGRVSAKLILDRIGGRMVAQPRRVVFPTELVMRGSCRSIRDNGNF
jgi:LacI family transcriptional regulator